MLKTPGSIDGKERRDRGRAEAVCGLVKRKERAGTFMLKAMARTTKSILLIGQSSWRMVVAKWLPYSTGVVPKVPRKLR